MSISEILKQARSDAELSQEAAAEKIGVSRQTMSNWENGKSYPDFSSVVAISNAYNVSLDSLMKGDTKMIEHLEKSTNVTRSNKQVVASIIALVISSFGIFSVIAAFGGDLRDFIDLPSWLALIIPILAVLTITRSFKIFGIGFRTALFPKREISDEVRKQAISLFRLLTKTSALTAVILTMIGFMNILVGMHWEAEGAIYNLPINLATAMIPMLYSLFLIVFILEPIVYILKKDSSL